MLATGSALTHATFVAQNSAVQLEPGKAEDFALVFIAPMDTPGQRLICRNSYEEAAQARSTTRSPARFDENDAVLIFDQAFIPWENVLVYRDVERATSFYAPRASCTATRCSRARASRSSSTSWPACSAARCRPTAPTSSAACRRSSASCWPGAT